jgi:mRNA interferase MazF
MVMQRGEIWWATLSEPSGSEPGYRRPILVIQTDEFNRSRIATVVGIAITSNIQLAKAPGNVLLHSKTSGLPKDSVANVSQIVTLNKSQFTQRIGQLPRDLLEQVEVGLRLVTGL